MCSSHVLGGVTVITSVKTPILRFKVMQISLHAWLTMKVGCHWKHDGTHGTVDALHDEAAATKLRSLLAAARVARGFVFGPQNPMDCHPTSVFGASGDA